MKTLSTKRLTLRVPRKEDAPFFFTLLNTEGWLVHIGDRNVRSISAAMKYTETLIDDFKSNQYGFYVVETNSTNQFIGMCGLIKRERFKDLDLGFAILPDHYRKGYTFEASKAVLNFGFNTLQKQKILGITSLENTASQNLLKKLGMREQGVEQFKGEESFVFNITKNQFNEHPQT